MDAKAWELLLPPAIPAVVGKEINVYFDNILRGDARRYDFEAVCPIGRHEERRWTAVPEKAGRYPLTIEVYGEDGDKLSSAQTVVEVCGPDAAAGVERKALFIGDSTTAAGHVTAELLRLFAADAADIELLGTQGNAPNLHEGRGGWKVETHYLGEESAFVFNGRFDFRQYMRHNGFGGLTDVCIHLGINDVFFADGEAGVAALLEREMPMLEGMIADIRAFDPGIRIGIMPAIPPSFSQDSFGASYGTLQSRRTYKRKLFLWNREIIARFGGREHEDIHLIPVNVNLDTIHNMPSETVYANSRSLRTVVRQNNGVHPSPEGYYQMADVIYYWFKNRNAVGGDVDGRQSGRFSKTHEEETT